MIPDIPPLNREDREIAPDDSPDSYRDIVLMSINDIFPVPVCIIPLFAGVDDPRSVQAIFHVCIPSWIYQSDFDKFVKLTLIYFDFQALQRGELIVLLFVIIAMK